jgi:uncharacterized integral membrane protein
MDKGQADGAVRRQFRGTGLYWTLILALVVAVAIVIGIIQNSQGVRLKFLGWAGNPPLAVVLLATIVLTVALTSLVGVIWRRRRRHQLTDSVELRELRKDAQASRLTGGGEDAPTAGTTTAARHPGASG